MIVALVLVALWAFAEAILFFIVADVPISYLALRYGWRKGVVASLIAAVAAAVGGVMLSLWAEADPSGVADLIVALPAIDASMLAKAGVAFATGGYLAMFAGSFSGIPYKLYAYVAADAPTGGVAGFFLASILVRLPRFLLVPLLVSGIGRLLERRLGLKARLILLGLCWTVFYGWYFATMPA